MTILDLIQKPMKRVSSAKGGEYHGACPLCDGTDRFHVWPEQGERGGTFWCRGCGKGGDAIAYLKQIEGVSCPDAFAQLGLECDTTTCPAADKCRKGKGGNITKPAAGGQIPERSTAAGTFSAPERPTPADLWKEKAGTFVDRCHQALLDSPAGLEWLSSKRGISRDTAIACRLGLNAGENNRDYYRPRTAWGLEDIGKKLWIPRGLVIPRITAGVVDRIRIRRPDAALQSDLSDKPKRYIVVPGSTSAALILPATSGTTTAWVIVESELDAILLWQLVGDIVGIMAMGNSSARPDTIAHSLLVAARHISVALDYDARTNNTTGRYENPGGKEAVKWWLPTYSQAIRTPMTGGKDPCDAWLNGVDLRAWVLAGLPPAYRIVAGPCPPMTTGQIPEVSPTIGEGEPSVLCKRMATDDGRAYWITDSREEWQRLSDAGETVFSTGEMQRVSMFVSMAGDLGEKAAAVLLEAKRVFPGSYLKEVCHG